MPLQQPILGVVHLQVALMSSTSSEMILPIDEREDVEQQQDEHRYQA